MPAADGRAGGGQFELQIPATEVAVLRSLNGRPIEALEFDWPWSRMKAGGDVYLFEPHDRSWLAPYGIPEEAVRVGVWKPVTLEEQRVTEPTRIDVTGLGRITDIRIAVVYTTMIPADIPEREYNGVKLPATKGATPGLIPHSTPREEIDALRQEAFVAEVDAGIQFETDTGRQVIFYTPSGWSWSVFVGVDEEPLPGADLVPLSGRA